MTPHACMPMQIFAGADAPERAMRNESGRKRSMLASGKEAFVAPGASCPRTRIHPDQCTNEAP